MIWNQNEHWKNIIIHLDDFYALIVFFGCVGKHVTGSGFEEVVFSRDFVHLAQLLVCYQESITIGIFELIIEF